MDSSSDKGRDSGQRSGGDGNRRNRRGGSGQNRNRNKNRSNSSGDNRRRNSGSDDDSYRPGSGGNSRKKAEPPKKKGLFSKIVGFFTGDDGSASNKGTGRPIQTPRKRPGDKAASKSSESSREDRGGGNRSTSSRPPREGGDRPKRKRSRRGGGGGGGSHEGNRDGGRGGRGPRRDRGRRDDRSASSESRSGDDRQPRAKREPRIVEVTSGRLYVGNLVYEVTEEDLNDLFKGFGNVVSAEIVTNQRNQQSKGFAFVEMGGVEEAKRAVEILHDKDFMGRKLVVTGAKSDGPVESRSDNADNDAAATPDSSEGQVPASETEAAAKQAEDTAAEAEQVVSKDADEEKPAG